MRVLLCGGGTAGHVNPALAIAETIERNEPDSTFAYVVNEKEINITKCIFEFSEEITNDYELTLMKFKIQCCDVLAHNPSKLEKRIKALENIKEIAFQPNDQLFNKKIE